MRWVRLATAVARDAEGHRKFVIGMGGDITERKRPMRSGERFEAALDEARDVALEASLAHRRFWSG
jgi:hypothetical protein